MKINALSEGWKNLSIRWKLQISFMLVAVLTTIYNRLLASSQFRDFIEITRQYNLDASAISALNAEYDRFIINSFWESGIEFVIQFFVIALFAKIFIRPILELTKSVMTIESGDYTQPATVNGSDEIGRLATHFNTLREQLNRLLNRIDNSTNHMGQSAANIASISQELEIFSNTEKSCEEETRAVMQQLSTISETVKKSSQETVEQAELTRLHAEKGKQSVQNSIQQMNLLSDDIRDTALKVSNLSESTGTIVNIIETIREIAGQTNLLALNAAIEAARAGEQGRGFAVVADEVRNLAERTTESAREVSEIIEGLTSHVDSTSTAIEELIPKVLSNQQTANETNALIEEMQNSAASTTRQNEEIYQVSLEQLNCLQTFQQTLTALFENMEKNGRKIANSTNISDSLFELIKEMHGEFDGLSFERAKGLPAAALIENDRRNASRTKCNLLVTVKVGAQFLEGLSKDLSETGILVTLNELPTQKENIEIEIFLPAVDIGADYLAAKSTKIKFDATMVRNYEQDGKMICAFSFVEIGSTQQKAIQSCLQNW